MSPHPWTARQVRINVEDDTGATFYNEAEGLVSDAAPGLVLVEHVVCESFATGARITNWSVTHLSSGRAVAWADDRANAISAAEHLARSGVDWTADMEALCAGTEARAATRDAYGLPGVRAEWWHPNRNHFPWTR